jgi:glc operon protein GlcG
MLNVQVFIHPHRPFSSKKADIHQKHPTIINEVTICLYCTYMVTMMMTSMATFYYYFLTLLVGSMLMLSTRSDAFSTMTTTNGRSECEQPSTKLCSSYMDSLATAAPLDFSTSIPSATPTTTATTTTTTTSSDFEYVPVLSLDHADAIANNVVACCKRNGFNPVTVHVLDSSGNSIVTKRMDGCPPVGIPDIAKAKAYSCIVNKYPSRTFRDRYTTEEASAKFCQMTTMVAISGNRMAPFPGGILLKLNDHIIGAVGVSGAAGDEDEYCAIRGVVEANLGLETVPETHSCSTVKDNF